ncbi:MAG TPA: type II toxin-antitoxin system prevent-host-death family antitoxin [Solirubrobacteraceae bacterium]|jgi:prevent-host-death family protein|nr:type II toxin-antitoxin system prevent-host-death family antitoxin [Solirubrobacteraceae bacterium]
MPTKVRRVGVHEAKTHLSRLLRAVEEGEEVVLMRAGTAVARIVSEPVEPPVADSFGMFAGQFEIAEDFDADSEELADLFGVPRA